MNRFLAATAAAMALATLAAPASAAVNARQLNQYRNIDAGLRSGKLTRAEVTTLRAEQHAIERAAERFKFSGRTYTDREKAKIHAMQDAAARHIDRLKHNARRAN